MKWNKILALLLSLMMILSMTAFADEVEIPSDPAEEITQPAEEPVTEEPEETTEEPETPEVPEEPETPEVPEETETPDVPEETETPDVPEETETPEETEAPEENEIQAFVGENRWPSGNSSVDHIDIACNNLKADVYVNGEWKTATFNFTLQEVERGTVKVDISSAANFTVTRRGTSDGVTSGSQVSFKGTFPVGTKDNPVYYTVKLTKSIAVDGVVVPVTLTATYSYWTAENDCPGLQNRKNEWKNGAVISGSGIDLVLSKGTGTSGSITIVKKVTGLSLDKECAFELYKDGSLVKTVECEVSKETNSGSVIISLLPFGTYTIKEVGGDVEGYKLDTDVDSNATLTSENPGAIVTVTNKYTYVPTTTSVSVSKVWNDADNNDGKRPASVTVKLLADGKETGKTLTLNAEGNWQGTFADLPLEANGEKITYTVDEVGVEGYTSAITGSAENGFVVTNTHAVETVSVSGSKTWDDANDQDGIRPASIKVSLWANGVEKDSKVVSADADGNWTWSFDNLPKYANGNEIVYAISEENVDGYTSVVDGYNLTNTHTPETVSVSGSKTWNDANDQDGKRPDSITIRLYADGKEAQSKTVTAEDGWKWEFTGLAKYDGGEAITYTIAEDAVEGYSAEIDGYNVTNSYTPGKTSVSVSKVWNDADNQDGIRPENVTVKLLANGKETGKTLTLNAEGNWQGSFTGLDEYEAGKKIAYTVAEEPVEGYTSAVEGFVITNTHETKVTRVAGQKVWDDANNQDGVRPDSITVNLLANGEKVAQATVTAETEWAFAFENLPVNANGQAIEYTVSEEPVEGYTSTVEGFVITNTYETSKIEVSGKKTWDDENDKDGKRPDSITINLLADGVKIDERVVTSKDGWSWSFTDLAKCADGKEIVYTITEDKVDGYTTVVKGYNVTNVHEVEDDEEVPKTGDGRSNLQGILLMAGLAMLLASAAFSVTAKKRGKN